MKVDSEKGYNGDNMATTNDIIGYIVHHVMTHEYLDVQGDVHYLISEEPEPISRGDAFRRLATFLDQCPRVDHDELEVVAVYRKRTPEENAGKELGSLLRSLCSRHGVDLGMTDAEIDRKMAAELEEFKAGGHPGFSLTGIPRGV